jgi:hypothetical protein
MRVKIDQVLRVHKNNQTNILQCQYLVVGAIHELPLLPNIKLAELLEDKIALGH